LPNRKGNLGRIRNVVNGIFCCGENPFRDFIWSHCRESNGCCTTRAGTKWGAMFGVLAVIVVVDGCWNGGVCFNGTLFLVATRQTR